MPVKNGNTPESRITLPDQPPGVVIPPALPAPPEASVLSRLLRMADSYRDSNSLRQALEIYWDLVENHAATPEAHQARQCLLAIGEQYEAAGKFHHAQAMYKRLMNGA